MQVPQDKSSGTNMPTPDGVCKKIRKDTRTSRDRSSNNNKITFVHYTFEVGHVVPVVPENDFFFYCHEVGEATGNKHTHVGI